jgi:hypothetical protein
MNQQDVEIYKKMQKSPLFFVECMWGLIPERDNSKYIKGKHLTWQQHDILLAVEEALKGGKKRISVRSGHGIGKSATLAMLILWYLFCYKDAQVPCTAPTSDQIHDILWKEVAKWLNLMPKPVREKYEWTNGYIRITESPETWFARAKTARKENPEALAGVHGDFVMYIVDEASGVPEEIFNTAEGALTGDNVLVILISNPTRLIGYFYDSHHKDKESWQTLGFSSIDSPLVDKEYVSRIISKHGEDSDEYKIRVLGEFPREDTMDDKGYIALFSENDIKISDTEEFIGERRLGIDPSGEGDDKTVWVIRDNFKAKIVAVEKVSNASSIAQKTMTLMQHYQVKGEHTYIDNFGAGANVAQELALAGIRVKAINVGDKPSDEEMFLNRRAEASWRVKQWFRKGGELVDHKGWDEILTIRYRKELSGKMKIMGKLEMKKEGIKSPDHYDALMMTFLDPEITRRVKKRIYRPKSLIGI